MTEVGQLGRGRAGVAGAVVAGPFDAVGVVAGSLDDAGVGSVPAFRVEVLFLVMLAHDATPRTLGVCDCLGCCGISVPWMSWSLFPDGGRAWLLPRSEEHTSELQSPCN